VIKALVICLLALLLSGCSLKPFGFAPWLIVLPGGRVNVTIGQTKYYQGEKVEEPQTSPELLK